MGACKVKKYVRREPEKTVLYQAVEDHFEAFLAARSYEGRDLPEYIIKEFREFLKCGRLEHGLVIVHCADLRLISLFDVTPSEKNDVQYPIPFPSPLGSAGTVLVAICCYKLA